MDTETYIILLIVALAVLYIVVPKVTRAYVKYRGKRVITCPETRKPAGVEVDATRAALTAAIAYPDLKLKSCSRWPERQDCGQECLLQVEVGPQDCLLRNILINWYADKYCVSCGRDFGTIQLFDHKPALLSPQDKTVTWSEVPAERVPAVLATHFPICWDCHILQTFRCEYPDMIVDRSRISPGVHLEELR